MIVVDSSALVAILEDESDADIYLKAIGDAPRRFVSAVNAYETGIVVGVRRGFDGISDVFALLDALAIEVVPFDESQVSVALQAYGRYGKGMNSKAQLNLGDCAAYALATSMKAPLLFKGNDFTHTDVPQMAPRR